MTVHDDRGEATTGDLWTGMTDDEILAYYRRRYPCISLTDANGTYRTWLRFRHLGAIARQG